MQRFKQPNMDLHPDGEWIRYDDHCEAMKRIAGDSVAQAEPVAWMRVNSNGVSTGVTDIDFYRDLWMAEGSRVLPLYAGHALGVVGGSQ